MTPDEKAELYVKIFGVSAKLASRTGAKEMPGLMAITADPKWDEFEPTPRARPIGQVAWRELFGLAEFLDGAVSDLPAPTPGADPDGFVWLTYRTTDGRELALEQHPDLTKSEYRWTQVVDGMPRRFECRNTNMRPLIESLRATFGQTAKARAARETLDIDRAFS